MIYFLSLSKNRDCVECFRHQFGRPAADRMQSIAYESIRKRVSLPPGTYVFTDLERLRPDELGAAAALFRRIRETNPHALLLNDPAKVLRRYHLLRRLHVEGINDFNVYREDECREPQRFPVFVRDEREHSGPLTPLLHTPEEVRAALSETAGVDRLVVEFVDLRRGDGRFHKIGSWVVGDRVMPDHFYVGSDWELKMTNCDPIDQEAPMRYFKEHPHDALLKRIFKIAGIEYGRADYGFTRDGRIQVFEINTNPQLWTSRVYERLPEDHIDSLFFHRYWTAVEPLDGSGGSRIPLEGLPGRPPRRWMKLVRRVAAPAP
ncbi:MAG: hypothetical protein V3T86_03640 [Planctomycetota bacterium]